MRDPNGTWQVFICLETNKRIGIIGPDHNLGLLCEGIHMGGHYVTKYDMRLIDWFYEDLDGLISIYDIHKDDICLLSAAF